MRKIPVILLLAFFAMPAIYGQIKIGDNPQAISPTSVLELESNDRVLVITRINTAQMDAIVPDQGAMVYNTDTQCIHYYDGAQWVNLCSGGFEIPENSISTEHIINGGINGVDIQNGSIGPGKLQNQSVTQEKLGENSVGAFALDNANINLSDFTNDQGFITIADVISAAAGNDIVDNGGAFYDDQTLQDDIAANTTAINAIGTPSLNEVLQQDNIAGGLQIKGLDEPTDPADAATMAYVDAQVGGGSDDQNLTGATLDPTTNILTIDIENGNSTTVNLNSLAGGGGTDGVVSNVVYTAADNNLTFTGANGGFNGIINLDDLDGGGGNQNLSEVLTQGNSAGGTKIIDLGTPTLDADAATKLYVDNAVTGGGTLADGTILIGDAGNNPVSQTVGGDATLANDGTLTIAANAIETGEIDNDAILLEDLNQNGADPGQIIKWNDTAGAWEVADDDTGTSTLNDGNIFVGDASNDPVGVIMGGDATIDNLGELTIADDAVELNMLAHPDPAGTPPPANGDVMVWDNDNLTWTIDSQAGQHTGTENAVFYAGPGGLPTTADDNANPLDDRGFYWDPDGRDLGGANKYGALYIGLEPGDVPSQEAKVHIADNFPGLTYSLHLQNFSSNATRTTGVLFSTVDDDYGKGSLIFDSQGANGIGDFHFLQNNTLDTSLPAITDAAFTIKNNKDIRLYGGIDVDGTPTGLGLNNQVLASGGPGNPVKWVNNGGLPTGTADEQVIKWNNTSLAWELGTDDGNIPDGTADDQVIKWNNTSLAWELGTDDGSIPDGTADEQVIKWNNTSLAWELGTDDGSIPDGTADEQVIKWNNTSLAWELGTDDGSIPDGTADEQVIKWNNTSLAWELGTDDNLAGTAAGSIFFSGIGPNFAPTENPAQLFWDNTDDKLYVGPQNPTANDVKLNVGGTTRTQGIKNSSGSAGLPSYRFTDDLNSGMFLPTGGNQLGFSANNAEAMRIDAVQNVGIGPKFADPMNDPIDARLHVDGDIYAEGDFYSTLGTAVQPIPDYVFEHYFLGKSELKENYDFQNLEEIEAFVKNNHHLPGIKSAATAMAEGKWNLGESNLQNLEKIEELFLHTIEQEKKIKALQSEKDTLTHELDAIKKDLEEIKALLKKSN